MSIIFVKKIKKNYKGNHVEKKSATPVENVFGQQRKLSSAIFHSVSDFFSNASNCFVFPKCMIQLLYEL